MSGDKLEVLDDSENIYTPNHKNSRERGPLSKVLSLRVSLRETDWKTSSAREPQWRGKSRSKLPTLSPPLIKVSTLISDYLLLWDENIAPGEGVIGNIEVTEVVINPASGLDAIEDMIKAACMEPMIPRPIRLLTLTWVAFYDHLFSLHLWENRNCKSFLDTLCVIVTFNKVI